MGTSRWGFLNDRMETVIDPQFDWADRFSDGLASVQTLDGLVGYAGLDGRLRFQIDDPFREGSGWPLREFIDGVAAISIPGRMRFIDKEGHVVKWFGPWGYHGTHEGVSVVQRPDGKKVFVDRTGKPSVPGEYVETQNFFSGHAVTKDARGRFSVIDRRGVVVLKPRYDHVDPFFDGVSVVTKHDDTVRRGAIDLKGTVLIPLEFPDLSLPCEGHIAFTRRDESSGIMKVDGTVVFEAREFTHVSLAGGGRAIGRRHDGKKVILRLDGAKVSGEAWDNVYENSGGLMIVCRDEKYGVVDVDGNVVLSPRYRYIKTFSEGLAAFETNR